MAYMTIKQSLWDAAYYQDIWSYRFLTAVYWVSVKYVSLTNLFRRTDKITEADIVTFIEDQLYDWF